MYCIVLVEPERIKVVSDEEQPEGEYRARARSFQYFIGAIVASPVNTMMSYTRAFLFVSSTSCGSAGVLVKSHLSQNLE